jgi:hypothetical protein
MVGLNPVGETSPFWSHEDARKGALANLLRGNSVALGFNPSNQALPQFDWAQKAQDQAMQNYQQQQEMILQNYGGSPYGANGSYLGQGGFSPAEQADIRNSVANSHGAGGYSLNALLRALGAQESGNRYGATNPSGALGRWQVMRGNIAGSGGWDMEALHRNITPGQFLNNPRLQNAIVRYKFGNYLRKYGAKGALSAWYSGDPNRWKHGGGGGAGYPSVYNYVMEVLNRL